jgi:signal transduction histidine kinase
MTVKTRITLYIVGAGFIASLLFSVVVFFELIEQPFEILDAVLKEEAYRTARMYVEEGPSSASGRPEALSQDVGHYWATIYDKDTKRILFQSALARQVKLPPMETGTSAVVSAIIPSGRSVPAKDKGREATFRTRMYLIRLNGKTFLVQTAWPMEKLKDEIRELVLVIFSGLILSTLSLVAISHVVAGKILQPIGQMKNLAQVISEKNLDQRIPAEEKGDEFSELAKTINRMLDRLQYSFVRQRDFLFDTSHELKTPLTTIRLAVDEICIANQKNLPPLLRDDLLRLNTQVLRMERLVKDLLNLSALETLTGLDRKPLDLTALLSSLIEEYRFLAETHHIAIEADLPPKLDILGDAQKLRRAFSNILDNAIKYNVEGGRIELTGGQSATEQTIAVTNTGPGVPEAEIPKVFDQFYRVEKSRSIDYGGSGLGLAIVKRIIDLHEGGVTFESRPGDWTRVTLRLPRRQV